MNLEVILLGQIPEAIIYNALVADSYSNCSFNTIIRASAGLVGQEVTLTIVPSVDLTIQDTAFGIVKLD